MVKWLSGTTLKLNSSESESELFPRLVLILVVLLGSIPFIGQAFHLDDRIYLEIAENILSKPFFPFDYLISFEGLVAPDAASHGHLPLISYYLAFLKLVTGSNSEWIYHLAFLAFPLLGAIGFYDLAKNYLRFPLPAAYLLAFSPAFFVSSHTLMTDVPLVAFWIFCLSRFLRICEGHSKRWDWVSCALSLLAAAFTSMLTVGLIVLMVSFLIINGRVKNNRLVTGREFWLVAVLLSLPILLWLVWYLRAYFHYDRFVLTNIFLYMGKREAFSWELMGMKGLSAILNVGGTFLFPLFLWCGFAGRTSVRVFLLIALFSFVPFYALFTGWTWVQISMFSLFFSSGLIVVWYLLYLSASVLRWGWNVLQFPELDYLPYSPGKLLSSVSEESGVTKQGEMVRLRNLELLWVLWFLGIIFTCLVAYHIGAVRYTLLALPPLLLLWMKALETRIHNGYFLRNLIWTSVVVTAIYSMLIGYGDYRFAESYRQSSEEITRQYTQPERTLWYAGEWGFRYYFEQNGARLLTANAVGPRIGDLIIKPYLATPWVTLYDVPEYSELLEQHVAFSDSPLRTLDFSSHAGFYSSWFGILPFSITSGERWEWFNVFRVIKEYDGPTPKRQRYPLGR